MAFTIPKTMLGKVVSVMFWDHVENHDKPVKCIVYGKLIALTGKYLTVQSWVCLDDEGRQNQTTYTIIRSTIDEVNQLT